jgi:hypothetical protein
LRGKSGVPTQYRRCSGFTQSHDVVAYSEDVAITRIGSKLHMTDVVRAAWRERRSTFELQFYWLLNAGERKSEEPTWQGWA